MTIPRINAAVAFIIAASLLVALTAAGLTIPALPIILLLLVVWATTRGGTTEGMVCIAVSVAATLAITTLRHVPMTRELAAEEIATTIASIILVFVVGSIKQQLDDARNMHVPLRMDAVAAEERLTRVLDSITDGFLTLDPDWHITNVNRRGEQMLGHPAAKLKGRYILDVFPESVGSVIHREMDRARTERTSVEIEALYSPGNRWFEVRGYPAQDGSMTVYFRDVTKRRRAQEALLLQARMLDTVRQAVVGVETDGVIFYWNRAAEELFGWRAEQVIGRTTIAIMQLDIDPANSERIIDRMIAGESWSDEIVLRRRDGSTFPALVTDSPIRDEKDAVLGMVRTVADLSERHADQQTQRFLAQAGSELASTLDLDAVLAAAELLTVPTLGDCCIVDMAEEEHASRRVESAWAPHLAASGSTRIVRRSYESSSPAEALLNMGNTALLTRVTDGVLRSLTKDPAELDRLRRGGVRSVVVTPLEAGGRLLGTMVVLSTQRVYNDVDAALISEFTRRVALAADNAIHFEAARVASKAKSDFLAVMSHELRTPLTTVMGYADLLLAEVSGGLPDQSRTYVDRIRAAAWHLLGLIEQILIYTRVEIGREQVHVERVPVDFVLRDAAELIEPVAGEKGLTFELVAPREAAYLDTDLTKLRQILLNLLANAIKFTDQGSIVLEANMTAQHVSFIVRDTGVGIAPEHLDRIFDSFWQVDQTATRKAGGTGLGLAVARKLARLLGGDVTASSVEGKGSEFVLEMPRSNLTQMVAVQ